MNKLIDFTNCEEIQTNGYDGANGTKKCIKYNNKIYLLKISSTTDKYTNGAISEYICCHIFNSIGIKAQNTLLGIYNINGKYEKAVACEDFILNETDKVLDLKSFANYKNQMTTSSSNGYGTDLNDIEDTIFNLNIIDNIKLNNFFWNMFIVDSLIGNFDRHNGNWGFLVNRQTTEIDIAPIYDCGSSLYPQLSSKLMQEYLEQESHEEINKRIYIFPNSQIRFNDEKINYYEFINSLQNKYCNEALLRIYPKIKINEINNIIDNTPGLDEVRKKFYKTILQERYEKILAPAYQKLLKRLRENTHTEIYEDKNIIVNDLGETHYENEPIKHTESGKDGPLKDPFTKNQDYSEEDEEEDEPDI